MKIEINNKIKRFVALEFIMLLILFLFSVAIFQIGNYLDNKNEIADLKIKEQIKNLRLGKKILWHILNKNNLYIQDFSKFKKQYEQTEDQIVLYSLCFNNSLYSGSLSEFRVDYFRRESALDHCYYLYSGDSRLSDYNIVNQNKENWEDINLKIKDFEKQLKNDSNLNVVYSLFVKDGYSGSEKQFQQLLFEENDIPVNISEYDRLINYSSTKHIRYNRIAENFIWLLIIFLYPLRILAIMVRWSLLQIKQ